MKVTALCFKCFHNVTFSVSFACFLHEFLFERTLSSLYIAPDRRVSAYFSYFSTFYLCGPAAVAPLDACPTGDGRLPVQLPPGRQFLLWRLINKYISLVILSLQLILEGLLSVSGEKNVHSTG